MKNGFLTIFCLVCLLMGLTSCGENTTNEIESVHLTLFSGECQGYCFAEFEFSVDRYTAAKKSNFPDPDFPDINCSTDNTSTWEDLIVLINYEEFQTAEEVIVCPGCGDGRVYTLTVSTDESSHTSQFEYPSAPTSVNEAIDKFLSVVEDELNECF